MNAWIRISTILVLSITSAGYASQTVQLDADSSEQLWNIVHDAGVPLESRTESLMKIAVLSASCSGLHSNIGRTQWHCSMTVANPAGGANATTLIQTDEGIAYFMLDAGVKPKTPTGLVELAVQDIRCDATPTTYSCSFKQE